MASSELIKAIAATAELCNKVFSPAAAALFAQDLEGYNEAAVIQALSRCRRDLKGPFTLEAVISRIDDGRPGVEEAWAMLPHDEESSIVWTEEMAQAWGVASPLMADGDRVGARMAFKESYNKLVGNARDQKIPPKWFMSPGRDVGGRRAALIEAVRHRRIGLDAAVSLLPADAAAGLLISLGVKNHPLLAASSKEGKEKLSSLLGMLKFKQPEP